MTTQVQLPKVPDSVGVECLELEKWHAFSVSPDRIAFVKIGYDLDADGPHEWGNGYEVIHADRRRCDSMRPDDVMHAIDSGAVPISKYEHGLVRFYRSDNGRARAYTLDGMGWDTVSVWGALVVPSDIPADFKLSAADAFLEDYTKWANGHVYYVFAEMFELRAHSSGNILTEYRDYRYDMALESESIGGIYDLGSAWNDYFSHLFSGDTENA